MKEMLEVTVCRYDPDKDPKPYHQSYLVRYEEAMTVLDVLWSIFKYHDGSLAFSLRAEWQNVGHVQSP